MYKNSFWGEGSKYSTMKYIPVLLVLVPCHKYAYIYLNLVSAYHSKCTTIQNVQPGENFARTITEQKFICKLSIIYKLSINYCTIDYLSTIVYDVYWVLSLAT